VQDAPGLDGGGDPLVARRLRPGRLFGQVTQELRRWRREVTGVRVLPGQGACPGGPGVVPHRARHDRGQAEDAPGTVDGQPLGDRTVQGRARDVRGADTVPVEHGDGVGGHVRQGIGCAAKSTQADRPVSRWSNRITWRPPATSTSTSSSGQPIPWAEVPMISKTAGSP
jgi:hypothetical protein